MTQNTSYAANTLESLERIRTKLVDTGARNSLINCNLSQTRVVRIVDELPDQIYDRLRQGKRFSFSPVPDPSHKELIENGYIEFDEDNLERIKDTYPKANEWAKRHDINPSYDLPNTNKELNKEKDSHSDDKLQTLLFQNNLDGHLKKIRQQSELAINESGVNVLYLALGFLEWYEDRQSDVKRLSPLFVVPISLTRSATVSRKGFRNYTVSARDDGLFNNINLMQRMKRDFGIILPSIDDEISPEAYFNKVSSAISSMDTRWKVRRYAAVCLLNFTKQLMYEDLNPNKWPIENNIANHKLIRQFFDSQDESTADAPVSLGQSSEYLIDEISEVHSNFPIVFDADSSQHSALIDVIDRKNLVIEGPPGTGKSQTITNLIAACMNKGLSVLFVAEKLAALEVVKRRLDSAQLGDFCLELHSHKSGKTQVISSLMDSFDRRSNLPQGSELAEKITQYENHRIELHKYAEKLNTEWASTGFTPHQIIQSYVNFNEQLPRAHKFSLVNIDASSINEQKIQEHLEAAERIQSIFESVKQQVPEKNLSMHPWFGVNNGDLTNNDREALLQSLENWTLKIESISDRLINLSSKLGVTISTIPSGNELRNIKSTIDQNNENITESLLENISDLKEHYVTLGNLHSDIVETENKLSDLTKYFIPDYIKSSAKARSTLESLMKIRNEFGVSGTAPLQVLKNHPENLNTLQRKYDSLLEERKHLSEHVPPSFYEVAESNLNGLKVTAELLSITADLPVDHYSLRTQNHADPEYKTALDEIELKITELQTLRFELDSIFNLKKATDLNQAKSSLVTLKTSSFFGFLSRETRAAKKHLKEITHPNVDYQQSKEQLPKLVQYLQGLDLLEHVQKRYSILGSTYQGINTNIKVNRKLNQWSRAVAERYSKSGRKNAERMNDLLNLDSAIAKALYLAGNSDLVHRANSTYKSIEKLQSIYGNYFRDFHENESLLDNESRISSLSIELNNSIEAVLETISDENVTINQLIEASTNWLNLTQDYLEYEQLPEYQMFVPKLFRLKTDHNEKSKCSNGHIDAGICLGKLAAESEFFESTVLKDPSLGQLNRLTNSITGLSSELDNVSTLREEFSIIGKVDIDQWLLHCRGFADICTKNRQALDNRYWLDTWMSYQRTKVRILTDTLSPLCVALEDHTLASNDVAVAIKRDMFSLMAEHMMNTDDELRNYDGIGIQAVREQFQRYDKELLELQRLKIATECCKQSIPKGNSSGKVGTFSEFGLIKHEKSKKTKHIPIRSLLKRAPQAIKALKPCFMMSPMSVAQYLEPGQFEFDIVVMDEASQIKPQEALGAIARANQLVVVGDPKQLPPTSFFDKISSNEDDDDSEEVGLDQAESILDSVIPIFPTRRLRWHYRSQHESLIAFSNRYFYDSNLVLFPSPFKQSPDYGIKFTLLENGFIDSGVNSVEAIKVVDRVCHHLLNFENESVGVVAMNVRQRDEIDAILEKRISEDPLLQAAWGKNSKKEESLFIKNLENVQGDERDVIIISMTYGPESVGGVTYQRFGPINSDTGWRRLNVLLTRSKKRMEIISSMRAGDVKVTDTSKLGVKSLRNLLHYCETGNLQAAEHTGRAPDSDFEISVIRKLNAAGYEAEPQVGVSGFYIDVAVRNPDRPGELLMGIECDGATYHSARSARDRDRLRQEILENLGWNIRRIWSTDWFRNPEAQMRPIISELEQLRIKSKSVTS